MQPQKLNVGCGTHILPGWINLDVKQIPGVDMVHDIEHLPLPFADNQFDEILCQDVLEHVEYIPVLKDLHRILQPGGTLSIRVPHFTSHHNFVDPTHKKMFSINTYDFFVKNTSEQHDRSYYFDFAFSSCQSAHILFDHGSPIFFLNKVMQPLVNRSARMQRIFESTAWSRLFPALNIQVTLVK
ncbi:MAG TPA: methyltransferase domain-containing protein [Candidatus Kapabacteria bacterium]|nr:methyltransferase domain-containing protein [Candidatus Kapabacteria bacterium]